MSGVSEGERFAPWLVLLSQHMPMVDGDCSCGSWSFIGHMPRLLAGVHERLSADLTASGVGSAPGAVRDDESASVARDGDGE